MTDEEWSAISRRDGSYDGRFFYGRKTTKKVCRPSCPVRLCSPKNIIIFRTFEAAADAGYTPCRRCRPDLPWWNGASAELAETARRYIDRHYAEKFSLEAIAGSLYVNGSYLTRIFRKYNGCTPLVYHNRVRCEEAKKLLENPDLSISFISDAVGYASSSHFSRVFRELTGVTPSAYRDGPRPQPDGGEEP